MLAEIVTDVTSPTITQLDVAAGGSTADVTLKADEDGTYYYVIKKANEKAPTISEIKTGGTKFNGNGPLIMHKPVKFTVSGLETMTDYVIYAIVIDDAENVSEKKEQKFSTIDNRPPTFRLDKGETMYGGKQATIIMGMLTTVLSNLVNNLPAVMFSTMAIVDMGLEPLIIQIAYLSSVIGSDIGALLTPIGTLATLIWMFELKKYGVKMTWRKYLKVTFLVIPIGLFVSLFSLYLWIMLFVQ